VDPSDSSDSQGEVILLVDDHEDGRYACETLLRHFGYQVHAVANGEEAIRLAVEVQPALVLMDLRMPVLDGWGAAAILKQDARTRGIPIIAFSAENIIDQDPDEIESLFDGWLPKPITVSRLLGEIKRLLATADRS
jgi:CheY-like chemotaxis protein